MVAHSHELRAGCSSTGGAKMNLTQVDDFVRPDAVFRDPWRTTVHQPAVGVCSFDSIVNPYAHALGLILVATFATPRNRTKLSHVVSSSVASLGALLVR